MAKKQFLLAFISCIIFLPPSLPAAYFKWYMVNVGNGDANYIKLPNGKDVLIDGGHPADGASILIPFLEGLGDFDGVIDYMVATHEDADHYGGFEALLGKYQVLKVYSPRDTDGTYFNDHFAAPVTAEGCPWIVRGEADPEAAGGTNPGKFDIGCSLNWDPQVAIRCLSVGSGATTNKNSIVLKMDCGESSFIFTGDLSYNDVITPILSNFGSYVPSDMHKVSHHGSVSDDANSEAWINAVHSGGPGYALISCIGSIFHPTVECLERLRARDGTIYMTFLDGTIAVITDGDGNYNVVREQVWDGTIKDPNPSTRAAYPPALPAGLRVTGQSDAAVTLDWDDVTADSHGAPIAPQHIAYDVFRSPIQGGDPGGGRYVQPGMSEATGIYERLTTSPVAGSYYADTSVAPGTAYFYRVSAIRTDYGYERRYSNEVAAAGPSPPPPTPTPGPHAGVILVTNGETFEPGFPISLIARVMISIWARFDAYLLADTPAGLYTIQLDGRIAEGVHPIAAGVRRLDAPYEKMILDNLPCPSAIRGVTELYIVIVEAGRKPPVTRVSDLRPDTPHVITMDKKTITVRWLSPWEI